MGIYKLSVNELVDIFQELEFESKCEGDFTEKDLILAVKYYCRILRGKGGDIPKK
jgi:hypothetical protein